MKSIQLEIFEINTTSGGTRNLLQGGGKPSTGGGAQENQKFNMKKFKISKWA